MTDKSLKIAYKKPSELKKFENNSRTHSESQIEQIERSIQEFGFTNPILIDEKNEIIAGHARLQAALNLEMDSVPTITLTGLTKQKKRAYVIADNKMALNSGWDEELLTIELQDLANDDFDLTLTGFDEKEINKLFDVDDEEKNVNFNYNEVFEVVVNCQSEAHQKEVFEKLAAMGMECRVLSM